MIAIVIPTINRSKYLRRALAFYDKTDFNGIIYVADSSKPEEKQKNLEHCQAANGNGLSVVYHYFEGPHDGEVIRQLNQHLHSSIKYVTFAGDDDFQVPKGLYRCAEFLDNNLDYVAAHGHRANFFLTDKNQVRLSNIRYGYNWDDSWSPLDRFKEYMGVGIALANYLYRKDLWIKRYQYCQGIPVRYLGGELVQEAIVAMAGKVKFLTDCVSFLFYQDNPDRLFSFDKTPLFDLVNSELWARSYTATLSALVQSCPEDIPEVEKRKVIEQELCRHIISVMSVQYTAKYGPEGNKFKPSQVDTDFGLLAPLIADNLRMVEQIVQNES